MGKTSLEEVWPLLSVIELIPERLAAKIVALNEPTVLDAICELSKNVLYNSSIELTPKDKRSLKQYEKTLIDLSNKKVGKTRKRSLLKKNPKLVLLIVRACEKFVVHP